MAKSLDPIWLGGKACIFVCSAVDVPALIVADDEGTEIAIHLGALTPFADGYRADMLAGLDTLAAAVQAALALYAPERFAQPGPDDPTDEPTDEPATDERFAPDPATVARWAAGFAVAQAHPMTEAELRTLDGNR